MLVIGGNSEVWDAIQTCLAQAPEFALVGLIPTGREGIEKAQQLQPDLILIDYNTGKMDNVAVLKQVRESVPTAGTIMMSFSIETGWLRNVMLAGVHNFLSKPISVNAISVEHFLTILRDTYEWHVK